MSFSFVVRNTQHNTQIKSSSSSSSQLFVTIGLGPAETEEEEKEKELVAGVDEVSGSTVKESWKSFV